MRAAAMNTPTTAEILALRELRRPRTGEAYVRWALGRLEAGDDGPSLRMLAESDSALNQFELEPLLEQTFTELGIASVRGSAALHRYAQELTAPGRPLANAEEIPVRPG